MESLSPGARALGTARFRLIMAGLKWTQPLAPRWALQAYGVAGYSFNRFVTSDNGQAPRGAPQSVLPSPIATIRNSAAAETGLKVTFDIHPQVALTTGAAFMMTKPQLVLTDGSRRSWDASRARLETAILFRVYGTR